MLRVIPDVMLTSRWMRCAGPTNSRRNPTAGAMARLAGFGRKADGTLRRGPDAGQDDGWSVSMSEKGWSMLRSEGKASSLDVRALDRARISRDPRFDGKFFIAVISTRIY